MLKCNLFEYTWTFTNIKLFDLTCCFICISSLCLTTAVSTISCCGLVLMGCTSQKKKLLSVTSCKLSGVLHHLNWISEINTLLYLILISIFLFLRSCNRSLEFEDPDEVSSPSSTCSSFAFRCNSLRDRCRNQLVNFFFYFVVHFLSLFTFCFESDCASFCIRLSTSKC